VQASAEGARSAGLTCLFIIQGEGRGHMTQALALRAMLEKSGHRVVAALVGRSERRAVPEFFLEQIGAPVREFESPNFLTDPKNRGVYVMRSLIFNLRRHAIFRASMRMIDESIAEYRPDVVVNFFDVLGGVYYLTRRPKIPMVAIGHQYMFHHPVYPFPEKSFMERMTMRWYTAGTAFRATRRLAISVYPAEDLPRYKLAVVPPLLREEVLRRPTRVDEPFLLVYLLNAGYAEEIIAWHRRNPSVQIHCFWDRPDAEEVEHFDESLTFHRLSGEKFVSMMAECRGLITTAGFESICEAMYLGKPVLMVPVEGHFEQRCNALDFSKAGAGIAGDHFDIDRFLEFIATYQSPAGRVRRWIAEGERRYVREIEAAAGWKDAATA
jgi:uncharacterized protein (TIGR00661 family)